MSSPNEGIVDVFVEISPSCNLKLEEKRSALIGGQIAQFIQSTLVDSRVINTEKLSIIKGKSCWAVQIDLLVSFCGIFLQ